MNRRPSHGRQGKDHDDDCDDNYHRSILCITSTNQMRDDDDRDENDDKDVSVMTNIIVASSASPAPANKR